LPVVTEQSWLDQSSAAFTTSTSARLDLVLTFAPLRLVAENQVLKGDVTP